jgi:hypothetical protein
MAIERGIMPTYLEAGEVPGRYIYSHSVLVMKTCYDVPRLSAELGLALVF